jgi:hypothetical protein
MKVQRIDFTPLEAAENLAKRLETLAFKIRMGEHDLNYSILYEAAEFIRRVASGELQPVIHAHWKEVEPGHDILFECSNCGRIISTSWGSCEDDDTQGNNGCDPTEEWLCCPTCGALIDGKDDSHED